MASESRENVARRFYTQRTWSKRVSTPGGETGASPNRPYCSVSCFLQRSRVLPTMRPVYRRKKQNSLWLRIRPGTTKKRRPGQFFVSAPEKKTRLVSCLLALRSSRCDTSLRESCIQSTRVYDAIFHLAYPDKCAEFLHAHNMCILAYPGMAGSLVVHVD